MLGSQDKSDLLQYSKQDRNQTKQQNNFSGVEVAKPLHNGVCCRIWSIETNMAKFIDKISFQRTIENVSHPIALPMTVLYYLFYVHLFVYTFQEHFVEQTQQ